MNLSKGCFFFIVLFTGSVAQESCPTRNVTATCNDKSCADTRTCRKVGRTCQCVDNCGWSCVRIGCEFVEAPENGNVIYDPENRTVGSTAYFSCSSGYVLSGNAHLECLETKEWNATNDVSCVAECNRDEAQVTALRRTCMKTCVTADDCLRDRLCVCDGVCGLSCIPTTRENYCDVTLVLVDNTVVTLDPATLVFGTVATISCSSGNIPIDGTREIQRSCLGNGDWSDGSLTCIPSDACRNPPEIENASRDVKLYYANGERLLYSCNPGYTSGSNSYLRCVDGNWSEANIRCIGKNCGYPGDIDNGHFIGRVYLFPNSVTYECYEGFELNGRPTINCQTTQYWDGIAPSCSPVQCPALNAPIDGGISYYGTDYNDRVEFSCDQGFSLHGESVLTCQGDGTWSSDVPECTGYCQKPREDVMWVFNDSCQGINSQPNKCGLSYLCDDGYFPINQKVIWSCSKGIWQKNAEPICSTASCNSTDLPYGDVNENQRTVQVIPLRELVGTLTRNGEYIRVKCPEGYEHRGSRYMKCKEGEWTPSKKHSFPGRPPLCINV